MGEEHGEDRRGGERSGNAGRREGNKSKEISLLCSQVCFHVPVVHAECKEGRTKLCIQVYTYVEISCSFMLVGMSFTFQLLRPSHRKHKTDNLMITTPT